MTFGTPLPPDLRPQWRYDVPLDPDPRVPDHWLDEQVDAAFDEGWTSGFDAGVRIRPVLAIALLVIAVAVGFLFGSGTVHAAPRAAQTTERVDVSAPSSAGQLGAPPPAVAQPAERHSPYGVSEAPGSNPGRGTTVAPSGGAPSPASDPGPASGASSIAAVKGVASWYGTSGPGIYAAAGPALRVGHWRGRTVEVCGNGSCVRLRLTDWCACPRRVIDLSSDAFRRLAPLSQGLVLVRVTWGGDAPRPPATDVEP